MGVRHMANLSLRIVAAVEDKFRALPCATNHFPNPRFNGIENVSMGRNIADFN